MVILYRATLYMYICHPVRYHNHKRQGTATALPILCQCRVTISQPTGVAGVAFASLHLSGSTVVFGTGLHTRFTHSLISQYIAATAIYPDTITTCYLWCRQMPCVGVPPSQAPTIVAGKNDIMAHTSDTHFGNLLRFSFFSSPVCSNMVSEYPTLRTTGAR